MTSKTSFTPCVLRIVAFIIKNIDMIVLFACLVGWLDSSPVEIKKIKALSLKTACAPRVGLNHRDT